MTHDHRATDSMPGDGMADIPLPDTMASFTQLPQWRPRIVTRFGPRLTYVDAEGKQIALQLSEADLWSLGQEVALALVMLRSKKTDTVGG